MSDLANAVSGASGSSGASGASGPSGANNDFTNFNYIIAKSTYSANKRNFKKRVCSELYEVLAITGREWRGNQFYYRVSWKDYTKDTWEPRSILIVDCPNLVNNVDNVLGGENRRAIFNLGSSKSENKEINLEINDVKVYGIYSEALKKTLDFFTNNRHFADGVFQRYILI
jgi:hypothetical protein